MIDEANGGIGNGWGQVDSLMQVYRLTSKDAMKVE